MKKYLLMCAAGGLLLASCSNEDVVAPQAATTQSSVTTPMNFNFRASNQSRGDALNTVHQDFGVWAMKTNDGLSSTTFGATPSNNVIMQNYLVAYNTETGTYKNTEQAYNAWIYEGFGSSEYTGSPSNNLSQYLKYWDGSFLNTWFVAYSPYIQTGTVTTPSLSINVEGNPELSFPNTIADYAAAGYSDLMFSIQTCLNENYLADGPAVALNFQRFGSRLRIALYEDIPGYYVTMDEVVFDGETATGDEKTFAIPYQGPKGHSAGTYVTGGKPTVTWDLSQAGYPATVSFTDATTVSTNLEFSLDNLVDAESTNKGNRIGGIESEKVYSPTILNVTPSTTNNGLQFVFNFTIHSEDTGEEIKVYNARVDVSDSYTNWAPNTLNTYIFKITKNVTGTTASTTINNQPEDPLVHALFPIIFETINIADEGTGLTQEFNVND